MFKVMLVDDEPNVRQGIKMMIPWDELGCEIIGEADDGDDGLTKIMLLQPDIVIADIKMPGKTGIEMTEAAKAMGYKGKVLILSGYSDFSYAKDAIALGVENFILKPVDEDELIEAIRVSCEKITKERERKYRQEIGREYLNEQLIKGLFAGDAEIASAFEKYEYSGYQTAIISFEGDKQSNTENYARVKKYFSALSSIDIVTVDISGVLGILFKGWNRNDESEVLERLYASSGDTVFIAAGKHVNKPSEIKSSYASAEHIYNCRFIYKGSGVVTSDMIEKSSNDDTDYTAAIYAYMEINDIDKLNSSIDRFTDSLRVWNNTSEKAKISFLTLVMEIASKLGKSNADKKSDELIDDAFMADLSESDSLSAMVEMVKIRFTSISDTCFGKTTKSNIERVVRYIRDNYNKELRLEMLAGIFGYNSAYLGKVFHQYTGDNFNNYLDEIRITEAKRLLKDENYKVYEVAEMVGYSNINYFHNKFKKYVGMSPRSYQKVNSTE